MLLLLLVLRVQKLLINNQEPFKYSSPGPALEGFTGWKYRILLGYSTTNARADKGMIPPGGIKCIPTL